MAKAKKKSFIMIPGGRLKVAKNRIGGYKFYHDFRELGSVHKQRMEAIGPREIVVPTPLTLVGRYRHITNTAPAKSVLKTTATKAVPKQPVPTVVPVHRLVQRHRDAAEIVEGMIAAAAMSLY